MKITVSQTFSKTFEVEEGGDKSPMELFSEQHWDISSLLNALKEYLEYDLAHLETRRDTSIQRLLNKLESCKDWECDEFEVIQENGISENTNSI